MEVGIAIFFLLSMVLNTKESSDSIKVQSLTPMDQSMIIICKGHFASSIKYQIFVFYCWICVGIFDVGVCSYTSSCSNEEYVFYSRVEVIDNTK